MLNRDIKVIDHLEEVRTNRILSNLGVNKCTSSEYRTKDILSRNPEARVQPGDKDVWPVHVCMINSDFRKIINLVDYYYILHSLTGLINIKYECRINVLILYVWIPFEEIIIIAYNMQFVT